MTKLEQLSSIQVKLTIEVTKEQFTKAIEVAYPEATKNVKIDGFRPGKVPFKVFVSRFGYEPIYEEAVNHAINETYRAAVEEHNVNVVDYPKIDLDFAEVSYDKGFTYTATVEIVPTCELKQYTGLTFTALSKRVTKKEVEEAIQNALKNKAENEIKEGAAEKGDTVVIDFEGFLDGVPFEGGKGENYDLELGSNSFIPGFEDQLIGTVAEQETEVHVTFPENYTPELAGKAATFKVTVHEVKTKVFPELTDEFVKELEIEGVNTVEEYRAHTEKGLKDAKAKAYEDDYFQKLFTALIKANDLELPKAMVENYSKELEEKYRNQAKQYNIPFEMFLQFQGMDEKMFKERMHAQAENQIKLDLIVEAVIKAEGFQADEAAIEKEYQAIADANKVSVEQAKKVIPTDTIAYQIQKDLAFDFLKKNNGPKPKATKAAAEKE